MAGIVFEPLFPAWVILMSAAALALGSWTWYRRHPGGIEPKRRTLLFALRVTAIVILVAVACGPAKRTVRSVAARRPLTIVLDTSSSMAIADSGAEGQTARLDEAKRFLNDNAEALTRKYRLSVYTFAEQAEFAGIAERPEELSSILDAPDPSGGATALGDAVIDAAGHMGPSAIVALSDGVSNRGSEVGEAPKVLGMRGVKVFAVPVGRTARPNVAVKRILGPRLLLKDEPSAFFAEVAFSKGTGAQVDVILKEGGREISRGVAVPSAKTALVRLNFAPDREGDTTYTVEVAGPPGEENIADNRRERTVRVAREKLKVLYVEESPRWEYRFLRNAVLRDDRIDPRFLLREADSRVGASANDITGLPASRAEFFKLDVVVIGDVAQSFFLRRDIENLRAFVSEGAGGVLFIAGAESNPAAYAGSGLGPLVPADPVGPRLLPGGESLALTDAGAASPALSLSPGDPKAFWLKLPQVRWVYNVRPRAAATVLAATADGGLPAIVEAPFGRGRTMLITTDELWRWRRERGDRDLYRLWAQLVRYLGARRLAAGSPGGEIILSSDTFALSDTVEVGAYLEDSLAMPLDEPSASGVLESADGTRVDLVFSPSLQGAGLYECRFPVSEPGAYTLYVNGPAGYLSAPFTVTPALRESLDLDADPAALTSLAEATGGAVLADNDLSGLLDLYPPDEAVETVSSVEPLWSSYIFLIPVAALLSAEWALRKRWNLP